MKRQSAAPRVLVVEDETLIALEIEATLASCGIEVVGPASTVDEALRLANSEKLDSAVTDMNLRGQSSYPVLKTLQAKGVPFIVVSGYANVSLPSDVTPHLRLHKPVDARRIADLVLEMLAATPGKQTGARSHTPLGARNT